MMLAAASASAGDATARDTEQSVQAIHERTHGLALSALGGTETHKQLADGWYLVLSWSIPPNLRMELLRGASRLNATIILNGLIDNSMEGTIGAMRKLVQESGTGRTPAAPDIVLDPVRIREWEVKNVPALVFMQGGHHLMISGRGSVKTLLAELAAQTDTVSATATWFERDSQENAPQPPPLARSAHYNAKRPGWPIAEEPLDKLLRERASRVDWAKIAEEARARTEAKMAAGPGLALPTVSKPRVRLADPSMKLDEDFRVNAKVLATSGSTVNPLALHNMRYRYLFIDGTNARHVILAKRYLDKTSETPLRVILTRGDWRQVADKLGIPKAYWASEILLKRWQIEAVPTLVEQAGHLLRIEEVVAP
jgi:type-F conjugative transfer system pilin assembly protein TrbC